VNNEQRKGSVLTRGGNITVQNPVILCADDEKANLALLEEILIADDYQVVTATSGNDALLKINNQAIDLVLLDINMPEMDGLEVCRQIKEDQHLRDIPIIMITGLASHEDRIRGIEAGVEDYFSKPFHQEELLARIKILLKMKKLNDERKHAECQKEVALAALQKSHNELDYQVQVRTAELAKANEMLQADIEGRKNAEGLLREKSQLNQTLLDAFPCIALLLRPQTREIIASNAAAVRAGAIPGSRCFSEWSQRQNPCPWCLAPALWATGEAQQLEVEALGVFWEAHWIPVSKDLYMHYALDITDRKKSEDTLKKTLESLRKAIGATVQVMVSAIETRDFYTAGHQMRAAYLARAIATEMGLPQDKIDSIRMAGSIHDIGKLSIPAEILSKPTKLSKIEFALIKQHARQGYEILKDVESPWPLAQIVYQHHERMDGSGYPRNLKGSEILMEARILSVADVVEAMASHRPYRPGLGIDEALNEIEKNSGTLYDDAVADACLRLFNERGYKFE
jgi:response regulator RpfG family c-di-GMP phosphodiesterase